MAVCAAAREAAELARGGGVAARTDHGVSEALARGRGVVPSRQHLIDGVVTYPARPFGTATFMVKR